jgi:Ca2+-binding EF-hand superfamily protein
MGCCGAKPKKSASSMDKIKLNLSKEKIGDDELKFAIPVLENCLPREAIQQAADLVFQAYDKDGNGHLDRKEMKTFLDHTFREQEIKFEITDEYLDQFYDDFDTDKSKTLEPKELARYMEAFFKHLVDAMKEEAKRRGLR